MFRFARVCIHRSLRCRPSSSQAKREKETSPFYGDTEKRAVSMTTALAAIREGEHQARHLSEPACRAAGCSMKDWMASNAKRMRNRSAVCRAAAPSL